MHEAAEANALALLAEQRASIEQFQSCALDGIAGKKDKRRKIGKKKYAGHGTLGMAPITTAI